MLKKAIVLLSGCFLALQIASPGYAAPAPLQMQDLFSQVQLTSRPGTPTVISPDGSRVAYTTSAAAGATTVFDARGAGHKQLWVVSRDGHSIAIGSNEADNWAPAWSPNGRYLAFYSGIGDTATLTLWDSTNEQIRALGVQVSITASVVQWLPDSQRMIVSVMRPIPGGIPGEAHAPTPAATPGIMVLQSEPEVVPQRKDGGDIVSPVSAHAVLHPVDDLSLVNTTGAVTLLAADVTPTTILLSPDATKLLYTVKTGEISADINNRVMFIIVVINLSDRSSTTIAKNIVTNFTAASVGWSHDGSFVSFVGGVFPGDSAFVPGYGSDFPGHVYIIDVRHPGSLHRLGNALLLRGQPPLFWNKDDTILYGVDAMYESDGTSRRILKVARADGRSTVVYSLPGGSFQVYPGETVYRAGDHDYIRAFGETGAQDIYDINLASGKARQVFHAYQKIDTLTFSQDGSFAAYVGGSASQLPDVWLASNGFAQTKQLTHLNPQIEQRALGQARGVSWQAEGQRFSGTLLLPAGYVRGKRYPMITQVYAGEDRGTEDRNIFGVFVLDSQALYYNMQLYASRGYTVFIPNSALRIGIDHSFSPPSTTSNLLLS